MTRYAALAACCCSVNTGAGHYIVRCATAHREGIAYCYVIDKVLCIAGGHIVCSADPPCRRRRHEAGTVAQSHRPARIMATLALKLLNRL